MSEPQKAESPTEKAGRGYPQKMEDWQYERIFGEKPPPVTYTEEEVKEMIASMRAGKNDTE